jgi:formate hydrogenlyase subunit 3/multisubunit Na+/H+ antiporter MnhD subunit
VGHQVVIQDVHHVLIVVVAVLLAGIIVLVGVTIIVRLAVLIHQTRLTVIRNIVMVRVVDHVILPIT